MTKQDTLSGKPQGPRFIQLIDRFVLTMVIVVTLLLALLGYLGLTEFIYERANDDLRKASMARYKAEVQHVVEAVATTIEATVPGAIGPDLSLDLQEKVKAMVRGAKFAEEKPKSDEWKGCFFLYDMEGTLIAHGDPRYRNKEGQPLIDWKDKDGVLVVKQLRDLSEQGGGFAEYRWEKCNEQGGTFRKISYAKKLRGDQWWLGTGVYVDDIEIVVARAVAKQNGDKLIAVGTLFGTLFALMLIALSRGNALSHKITQPLVERMQALAKSTDEQRRSLVGQLHHMIERFAIKFDLMLNQVIKAHDIESRSVLVEELSELIKDFSKSCGKLYHEIYPQEVVRHGAGRMVKNMVHEQTEAFDSIGVQLVIEETFPRSDSGREVAVYLVAQGLVQNIIKHAQASKIEVLMTSQGENMMLLVKDNGKGFDPDVRSQQESIDSSRDGLRWMLAQVDVYGGSLEITSSPGNGTNVSVTMPWPKMTKKRSMFQR